MAVTTTPSIHSLVEALTSRYPHLHFEIGGTLAWQPAHQTIVYDPSCTTTELLHEVGHATLKHRDYSRDITLLGMERSAWDEARMLAQQFDVTIDEGIIDLHLDTYRDWLHRRSNCPQCAQTGLETAKHTYSCVMCGATWRVNDGRICQQRRYMVSP